MRDNSESNTLPFPSPYPQIRPNRGITSKIAIHVLRKARLGTLNHSDGFYLADDVIGSALVPADDVTGSALVVSDK